MNVTVNENKPRLAESIGVSKRNIGQKRVVDSAQPIYARTNFQSRSTKYPNPGYRQTKNSTNLRSHNKKVCVSPGRSMHGETIVHMYFQRFRIFNRRPKGKEKMSVSFLSNNAGSKVVVDSRKAYFFPFGRLDQH